MTEKPEDDRLKEKPPERPLECSECKKPISVRYTEIIGDSITHTSMCADCPELQRRLQGVPLHHPGEIQGETTAGLACGSCGTTLESLRVGLPVGCSACYEIFDDILLSEMLASEKIPPRITTTKKSIPIHIGRTPGEIQEMNPSLRLLALNEALNETLKREDYEQAAWLRDQIKALTEHPEETDERK
jgi:protein arginine kinase activator